MTAEPIQQPGTEQVPAFLRDLWYMAALASDVRRGQVIRRILLGEPVVIGRMRDGTPFALRDICPHRGVPLSAGRIKDDATVECPYHGWRFKADGVCAAIPSLVEGQDMDPSRIRVRAYPLREQDGLLWIYMAAAGRDSGAKKRPSESADEGHACPALRRAPDLSLRHRSRRHRPDGPRAWTLCAQSLVVAA